MLRRATARVTLLAVLVSATGCASHKAVQDPAARYARSRPTEPVCVVAVFTKAGRVDFPRDSPALLVGDRVVVLAKGDRPVTVKRADAVMTTRNDEVSIAVEGKTYEDVRIAAEAAESITFLPASASGRREFPLSDVDRVWLRHEGRVAPSLGVLALIVVVPLAIGAVAFATGDWF